MCETIHMNNEKTHVGGQHDILLGLKTSVVASSPMLNTKVLKTWRNRQKVIDLRTTGGRYFGYKTRPSPPCTGLLTLLYEVVIHF
jgi:hypothetical protein